MCDIDHFKAYNDTYGHVAGDKCICIVAQTIKNQSKRASDIPARYGGEEFGIILPNTGYKGAKKVAKSIRKKLENQNIPHESSPVKNIVTISIGAVILIPKMDTQPSALISLADAALYESKKKGRNQVTIRTA